MKGKDVKAHFNKSSELMEAMTKDTLTNVDKLIVTIVTSTTLTTRFMITTFKSEIAHGLASAAQVHVSTFSVESIVAVITSWHGAGLLAKLRALAYVPNDACKPLQKFACAPLREADGPGTRQTPFLLQSVWQAQERVLW